MAQWLRLDTGITLRMGPFLDPTSLAEETALSIGQSNITLKKKDSNDFGVTSDSSPTTTHDSNGWYHIPLTTTDINTEGPLIVRVVHADALQVWQEFTVVPQNVYDSLIDSGTDKLQVDVVEVSGDSTAADNLEADYDGTGYNKTASTVATVSTLTGHTAQTGDSFARLGAPAGASVSADIATVDTVVDGIDTNVDTLLTRITSTIFSGITSLANWLRAGFRSDTADSTALTEINSGGGAYDEATESQQAIRDRGDVDWSSGAAANPNMLLEAEVATVTSQTEFTLATGSDDDDAYNDQAIVLYDDSNNDYPSVRVVSDYTGSTRTVTIDSGPDFTLGTDDSVKIFVTAPGTVAPTAAQVADAVLTEHIDDHSGEANSLAEYIDGLQENRNLLLKAEIDVVSTQTSFTLTSGATHDDAYNDMAIVLYDVSTSSYPSIRKVTDYTGSTRTVTIDSAPDFTLDAADFVRIYVGVPGSTAPTVGEIADAVLTEVIDDHTGTAGSLAEHIDAIHADTNELQVDDIPGTLSTMDGKLDTIDGIVDDIVADTNELQTDDIPGTLTTMDGKLDTIDGIVDAIVADTNELQTDDIPGTLTTMDGKLDTIDGIVDSIVADTGTDGVVIAADAISSSTIATGAIDAAAVSAAAANKIADHVYRRDMSTARASSDGDTVDFRSLLGALSFLCNRRVISATTLTIYEENDTTTFETAAVTGNASADPISEINPSGP